MILPENDGGHGGGLEVPVREDVRVERSVWEKTKKWKERKTELAEEGRWGGVKCVVGMVGGVVGRHVRPIKNLTFIFFFFFGSDWDVTWEVTLLRLCQLCPSPPQFVSNSCFVLGFSWWMMKCVCRGFLVSQMGFLEFLVSWVFLLCFYLSLCVCVLYKFMYFVCFYLSVSWVIVIAWFWVLVSFIDFDLDFYTCVCIRICVCYFERENHKSAIFVFVFMLGFVFVCGLGMTGRGGPVQLDGVGLGLKKPV